MMLSEGFLVWTALQRNSLTAERTHPRVTEPGRTAGPCLRVPLDADGDVSSLEGVTEDEWPGLWTIREGNHNSFPVARQTEPLLHAKWDDPLWQALGFDPEGGRRRPTPEQVRKALLEALERLEVAELSKGSADLWSRLRDKKAVELIELSRQAAELKSLGVLGERFTRASANPQRLMQAIAHAAQEALRRADLSTIDVLQMLLVGKSPPPGEGDRGRITVQLAFDVSDAEESVYTKQMRQQVIAGLLASESLDSAPAQENAHLGAACAFTGGEGGFQLGAFPKAELPVLGKAVPLFSMFSEAGCNQRYGMTDSQAVPVAREVSLRVKDSFEYLVEEKRRGETWLPIASGRFEGQGRRKREIHDLLLCYVAEKPELAQRLAALFAEQPAVDGGDSRAFEAEAKVVCDALRGEFRGEGDQHLQLFVIRRVSEGQAQVVVARRPNVAQAIRGAEWWQAAVANIPAFRLPFPVEKGVPARLRSCVAPYPDTVVRLLADQWVAHGTRANKVPGVGVGTVLDLLLDTTGDRAVVARTLLSLATQRLEPLLLGLGGAVRTREWDNYPPLSREAGLRAVSLFGILLKAVGRGLEAYMHSTPFLIGRLLGLADTLHREYCIHVRRGEIPPQLIGNALMPAAAENPCAAVDRLRDRLNVYIAWATRVDGKEPKYRLCKWALGRMRLTCQAIHEAGQLPKQANEAERAELFLGYLAPIDSDNSDEAKQETEQ